jgi:hypothetical protein
MSTEGNSSRRNLLKRALIVLGVGVLVQPNGGVSGSAFADNKSNKTVTSKSGSKALKPFNKTGSKTSKAGAAQKSGDKVISGYAKSPQ